MTAWAAIRRFGITIRVLGVVVLPSLAAGTPSKTTYPAKLTPTQLRNFARKAEKNGDWEAAFNAYCHLFVSDRNSPELREKLNASLRRVQQLRRHRDPGYQQFAAGMSLSGSLDLFAEVMHKVPVVYADRDRATPQHLWSFAIEELDRASPTRRSSRHLWISRRRSN